MTKINPINIKGENCSTLQKFHQHKFHKDCLGVNTSFLENKILMFTIIFSPKHCIKSCTNKLLFKKTSWNTEGICDLFQPFNTLMTGM